MRAFILSLTILGFALNHSYAQYNSNDRIFRLIKNENFEKAIAYGNHRIETLKKKGNKKLLKKGISTYMGLGLVYEKSGNFIESEKNYRAAQALVDQKKANKKHLGLLDYDVDDEMAMLFLETGNFQEAGDLLKTSVKVRKERFAKTNLLRYRPYLAYGQYYYNTNQPDSAYYYLSRYILYIKNSNHNSKQDLNKFADAYEALVRLEISRDNLIHALHFAKKNRQYQFFHWTRKAAGKNNINKIQALNLLAEVYRLMGDMENANKYSQKAFSHYNESIEIDSYYNIPLYFTKALICWDEGKYPEAERNFFKAMEQENDFIDQNFFALTEYEKENFYTAIRSHVDLLNAFAVERATKTKLTDKDSLISKIYNYQIRTKAIILSESNKMLKHIFENNDTTLTNTFLKWRQLKNELINKMVVSNYNENDVQTKQLKLELNQLEKAMTVKTALFKKTEKAPEWHDIKAILNENEASIEIIRVPVYGQHKLHPSHKKDIARLKGRTSRNLIDSVTYFALSVDARTGKNPSYTIIADGNTLEKKFYRYYQNAIKYKQEDTVSYRIYWKPLEKMIAQKRKVYVSADGVYNMINLSILKIPQSKNYVIDKTDIINVTNTKELLKPDLKDRKLMSALLIGRPAYSTAPASVKTSPVLLRNFGDDFRGGVGDLPGTEKEIKNISATLKKQNIHQQVLLGREASEANLKDAASQDIIHIATHGFFDARNTNRSPMLRSGLLLAGVVDSIKPNGDDGILTAFEASNLDLNKTQLVVLSACETGKGEIKSGEGVYGLQRAFEVAGVRFILMSMWTVSDQATADLMDNFYSEFIKTNNVLDSFKKAEIKVRKTYPECYYWGAFKLIGN